MPRDPVCGVVLDEKTAKFKSNYGGETYYFCSVKCKKKSKEICKVDQISTSPI